MPPAVKPRTTDRAPEFMQPIQPATGDYRGEPFVLNPREIFASDHRLVRAYPHLFRAVEQSPERPAIETMTAAPGEKR
jgi:hypothetical protein